MTECRKISPIRRFESGTIVYAKVRGRWRKCVVVEFTEGFHEWMGNDGHRWFGLKDRVKVRPLRGAKTYDLVADRRFVQLEPPMRQLTLELGGAMKIKRRPR